MKFAEIPKRQELAVPALVPPDGIVAVKRKEHSRADPACPDKYSVAELSPGKIERLHLKQLPTGILGNGMLCGLDCGAYTRVLMLL